MVLLYDVVQDEGILLHSMAYKNQVIRCISAGYLLTWKINLSHDVLHL